MKHAIGNKSDFVANLVVCGDQPIVLATSKFTIGSLSN